MKKRVLFCLLVFFVCCVFSRCQAGSQPQVSAALLKQMVLHNVLILTLSGRCGSGTVYKTTLVPGGLFAEPMYRSYVLTAGHVVGNASAVVLNKDGRLYPAAVIYRSTQPDIAVLSVDIKLSAAELASSYVPALMQQVFISANPDGFPDCWVIQGSIGCPTFTGTVSGCKIHLVGVVATSQPGMSGGAVYNLDAKLVGIYMVKFDNDTLGGFIPLADFCKLLPK